MKSEFPYVRSLSKGNSQRCSKARLLRLKKPARSPQQQSPSRPALSLVRTPSRPDLQLSRGSRRPSVLLGESPVRLLYPFRMTHRTKRSRNRTSVPGYSVCTMAAEPSEKQSANNGLLPLRKAGRNETLPTPRFRANTDFEQIVGPPENEGAKQAGDSGEFTFSHEEHGPVNNARSSSNLRCPASDKPKMMGSRSRIIRSIFRVTKARGKSPRPDAKSAVMSDVQTSARRDDFTEALRNQLLTSDQALPEIGLPNGMFFPQAVSPSRTPIGAARRKMRPGTKSTLRAYSRGESRNYSMFHLLKCSLKTLDVDGYGETGPGLEKLKTPTKSARLSQLQEILTEPKRRPKYAPKHVAI